MPAGHRLRLVGVLGELVQTTAGKWITHPPTRCPNGHQLGPGEVLVGHQACLGHGGGHTTWTCRSCDETVYGPPLNTHCTTLAGPAALRISTRRDQIAHVAGPTAYRGVTAEAVSEFRRVPHGHPSPLPPVEQGNLAAASAVTCNSYPPNHKINRSTFFASRIDCQPVVSDGPKP